MKDTELKMAKIIETVVPTEKSYRIELTQSEVDMLVGIVSDLCDNPQRKVSMVYEADGDVSFPSEYGAKVLKSILDGIGGAQTSDIENYDYYDYWDSYPLKELDFKTT
jgi:predicted AAA+ superfamily ATPase